MNNIALNKNVKTTAFHPLPTNTKPETTPVKSHTSHTSPTSSEHPRSPDSLIEIQAIQTSPKNTPPPNRLNTAAATALSQRQIFVQATTQPKSSPINATSSDRSDDSSHGTDAIPQDVVIDIAAGPAPEQVAAASHFLIRKAISVATGIAGGVAGNLLNTSSDTSLVVATTIIGTGVGLVLPTVIEKVVRADTQECQTGCSTLCGVIFNT